MQQMFESWIGAWRSFADPARAAAGGAPAQPPFAAFQPSQPFPFAMPAMPQMPPMPDWSGASASFAGLAPVASVPPARLQTLQADYSRDSLALIQQATAATPTVPDLKDRRFSSDAWKASPAHAFAAAWYLLNARYLQELADALETDPKTRERIRFAVQQWTAAAAPSNFLALNPEAQKNLVETQGESLRLGMKNLLADMQRGKISQTDETQFVVGKNLAVTEGAVVYENDLIQLIQYKPTTATVFERPLLIVPPCINKFYILDLQPENSLVAHALSCGHQVFLVSWRNADASVARKNWDDYMDEGLLAAIDAVQQVSGREQINTLGFCVGGTMLATALAVLASRGEHPAASMTLLTAMLDFSDTGILDVFVDEAHVQMREQTIGGKNGTPPGLMRGVEFANTFSFLRPNDLVWNYVVDNYLKGRTPAPFDLLYWNSDSTSLPGPMYAWYLRNTYLENKLREPDALVVCGEPVDLSRIDVPTFIYGSREDHIVPWQTAYESTSLLAGPLKFVLGASGHIAGVINPPAKKKRSYWSYDASAKALPESANDWLDAATEHPGSWWPVWIEWLDQYGGRKVKPRAQLGSAHFPVIEPAPGRYVMQRD
ncbi:class I poly(R)-hydroxyalkanoic acid synthase [Burkholderia savannae]|uniref:class I poly(R)-hydroxyalkanoic acid synthase n=1 Tax=Burkholderia TaxID=32008 RepID=UPI000753579B|nr:MULTISPECIES: class I poly(R)-hydroxyalkanoic acid synthase [unclassified Burkholderia]AOJ68755.1 poly-beta-hydroxybutyrate polymerase [Burkholderia savannae]KVG49967.1 poly-beta-hydroxybutyrate polymerase [Burkholderia sp. MSMB0265]KVG83695.1 poly-beta-hydroxybutyrate polymerase [Burkholderia sp. MSMB2040]KVG94495.1 poly-beta-hydroxybutyrate polymerase [Burkholderia sp. MSMB2041]KVG95435.1 poly-beta-hydroxybutyrate polymerase [Burkholderia sp. MSMB2042]